MNNVGLEVVFWTILSVYVIGKVGSVQEMNCWHCNAELIWGGDHDAEDHCEDQYSIVTNFHCP